MHCITEGLRQPGWYFRGDPWLEMDWGHVDYTWSLKYVSLLGVNHWHLIALLTLCWYSVPQDLEVPNHTVDSVWALPVCPHCSGPLGDNTARTGSRPSNIEHVWTLGRKIELLMSLCQSHFNKHWNVSINNWKHIVNDGECKDLGVLYYFSCLLYQVTIQLMFGLFLKYRSSGTWS